MQQRQRTTLAVEKAQQIMQSMPMHYQMMVGDYTRPMVLAILEINAEIASISKAIELANMGSVEHGA